MPRGHLALTRRSEMGRGRPANTKLSPRATVAVTSRHKSHIWEPHARAPAARPTDPPRPPALTELARTLAHAARGRRGPLTLNSHRAPQWQSPRATKVTSGNHTRASSLAELERARVVPRCDFCARGDCHCGPLTLNSHRAPQWQSPRAQ